MDERRVSLIAIPIAEIVASAILVAVFPASPLSSPSNTLFEYLGTRAGIVLLSWCVLVAILWLFRPGLLRRRHNLNRKFAFLAGTCLAGVIIDNAVTFQSLGFSLSALASIPILRSMATRTFTYILCFAFIAGTAYYIEARRLPGLTPPPRYGPP